ncbi:NACHT domain-containing NTPase [Alkalinema sp. FACHB-956]|uniref:NACHT domain-containing protein n=1 Tax=Alkalinema sp. FACHB-956 TaxID=2692768 RepID=UPI001681E499|nr:NACHT domain-containing NTPase [Alkalinema sp. FACHB-956]MBD2328918.1 NACHT domain-containing NTPase [Alkalinema sp. FACHB-956]
MCAEAMADRSLQATPEGIQLAKVALKGMRLNQITLAQRLEVTRQPIGKFFRGETVSNDIFVRICEVLNLDWQVIAGISVAPEVTASTRLGHEPVDLPTLVQSTREAVRPHIQKQCGTMRVLDMEQPIELTGDRGIYTHVNILERVLGRRRLGVDDPLRDCDVELFDRFGLVRVTEQRVPGRDAVLKYRNLLVLGKPGAGKTTFLKYLAMQCLAGDLFADRVPLFVTLKDFAESPERSDLVEYLEQRGVFVSVGEVLRRGRGLVLLDGLDEVREEDTPQVLGQIRELVWRFGENAVVVTCRIAAQDYSLENFVEVQVDDFDENQIVAFVRNWFRAKGDESRAALMVEKLQENAPIQELASSPLLLTLLCLIFEDAVDFPVNRAELYKEGIDLLLKKWDKKRKVERDQIYKKLSLKLKENLLSSIALKTFKRNEFLIKQRVLEDYISDYIGNLPDAKDDPEALHLDSEAILRSIEAQHGLLVEQARGIYSFSHLTFQEYFVAWEIAKSQDDVARQQLVEQITDKRWQEVFLLTVGMLRNADKFLLAAKEKVDEIVVSDEKIQRFLQWVNGKAKSVKVPYKNASVRTCYFLLSNDCDPSFHLVKFLDQDLNRMPEMYFAHEPEHPLEHDFDLDCILKHLLDLLQMVSHEIKHYMRLDKKLDTEDDPALYRNLECALEGASENCSMVVWFLEDTLDRTVNYLLAGILRDQLQRLNNQINRARLASHDVFRRWWRAHGKKWTENLRQLMITHRNIGHDWQFTEEQKQLLRQYYDANLLLVQCLNSDCYVSRSVRQEIEETLLLPEIPLNPPSKGGL